MYNVASFLSQIKVIFEVILYENRQKSAIPQQQEERFMLFICFSKLLQEEPFEKISVSDICNEAHIPRATFYTHFNDKEDLLASYCSSFLDTMSMKPPAKETNIEEYARYAMRTLLMNLSRDQEVYRRIYQKNEQGKFLQELKHCMHSKLKEYFDSTDQHILIASMDLEIDLLSNLFITLSEWLF